MNEGAPLVKIRESAILIIVAGFYYKLAIEKVSGKAGVKDPKGSSFVKLTISCPTFAVTGINISNSWVKIFLLEKSITEGLNITPAREETGVIFKLTAKVFIERLILYEAAGYNVLTPTNDFVISNNKLL